MEKAAGRIIRADNVKLEGQYHLDVGQVGPSLTKGPGVASATPQVCIVEKHPQFAVIEITCSCGTKTYLRCESAGTGASEVPDQEPDQTK